MKADTILNMRVLKYRRLLHDNGRTAKFLIQGTLLSIKYFWRFKRYMPVVGAAIKVVITGPDGVAFNNDLVTDASGNYTVSFTLSLAGTYLIAASYAGDATHKGASTTAQIVATVQPVATTLTLTVSEAAGHVGDVVKISGNLS